MIIYKCDVCGKIVKRNTNHALVLKHKKLKVIINTRVDICGTVQDGHICEKCIRKATAKGKVV